MRNLRYTPVSLLFALALPLACTETPGDDMILGGSTTGPGPTSLSGDSSSSTSEPVSDESCGDPISPDTGVADGGSTDDGPMGQICGDGYITGTEACDCGGTACTPAGLDGQMCAGLMNPSIPDRIYTGGLLDCNPASCQFDFTTCTWCGDGVANGNEQCEPGDDTGVTCMDLGMGDGVDQLPCGDDCTIDTSSCV